MTQIVAPPSARTRVRRFHKRARYDRTTINAVLDAGVLGHAAFLHEGHPVVLPTLYWRDGSTLYWHGSRASRMMRAMEGARISFAVAHLDGLVLARSAFHHSANYRSVVLFGEARLVRGETEKLEALRQFMERLMPGRWKSLRPVKAQELKATHILAMPIDEVSAKIRSGPPIEDEADLDWPCWSGVIPLALLAGAPQPDPRSHGGPAEPPLLWRTK